MTATVAPQPRTIPLPYRNAWIWCLALVALTIVAFWPGYLSR